MMGKLVKVILFFGLLAGLGFLIPRGVVAIGGTTNDTYTAETFAPINGSIATTAGTIYQFNLSTQDKTYRWVGLWGNITGSVQLRTSTNTFYSWPVSTVTAGSVVYATTDVNGIDVTNFLGTNDTYLNQADTAYGYVTTVSDSITNTFDSTPVVFQSPSMQNPITVNSTTVGIWENYMIKKTTGNIATTDDVVWAVDVNPAQQGFNSQYFDFEMMVPENEEVGDGEGVQTTYYLWIELK